MRRWHFPRTTKRRHAKVKGEPVPGTGRRHLGRYRCSGCEWCGPKDGTNRTARERRARKNEESAE